ncbi:hypothetical protein TEA_023900 [Camellia sinensis var. sinensis]|uniref:Uncharacterized protein n=1 Tax=Camellia sinensis var. sinensis TaxID=542762 RepID=A0A4S4DFX0_CAMSN|nr:hypothetical protein TEA_023900 [Camellia sinensis var. sinensis]
MWKLNQSILGGDEELQDNLLDGQEGLCSISPLQRIYGFAACLVAGFVCMFLIPKSSEPSSVLGLINGVTFRLRLNPFEAKRLRSLGSWIRIFLSASSNRSLGSWFRVLSRLSKYLGEWISSEGFISSETLLPSSPAACHATDPSWSLVCCGSALACLVRALLLGSFVGLDLSAAWAGLVPRCSQLRYTLPTPSSASAGLDLLSRDLPLFGLTIAVLALLFAHFLLPESVLLIIDPSSPALLL